MVQQCATSEYAPLASINLKPMKSGQTMLVFQYHLYIPLPNQQRLEEMQNHVVTWHMPAILGSEIGMWWRHKGAWLAYAGHTCGGLGLCSRVKWGVPVPPWAHHQHIPNYAAIVGLLLYCRTRDWRCSHIAEKGCASHQRNPVLPAWNKVMLQNFLYNEAMFDRETVPKAETSTGKQAFPKYSLVSVSHELSWLMTMASGIMIRLQRILVRPLVLKMWPQSVPA